jgi:membrane-associated phospholipid phosphatase
LCTAADAGAQQADPPRFGTPALPSTNRISSDVWIAAGFVGGTIALSPFDRALAHVLQDPRRQENVFLQRSAASLRFLGFPGSVIIGASVYAVGLALDDRDVASFGLHGTEAIFVSSAFVYAGKTVLGRARPYDDIDNSFNFKLWRGFSSDRYQSFPSGHTAAAFAVASALTAESGEIWPKAEPYIGPLLYTGATFVGISRMYNNRHWATDVIAGAAVGVLTGSALIRYLYAHDNWVDNRLLPGEQNDGPTVTPRPRGSGPPLRIALSYPVF